MRLLQSILALLFCCTTLYAVTPEKSEDTSVEDSLLRVLLTASGKSRAKTLNILIDYYYAKGKDTLALSTLDDLITLEQSMGREKEEGVARWRRIVVLNNFSRNKDIPAEVDVQMAWFKDHQQWDYFYRVWQRKTTAYCTLGKMQLALQDVQQMLNDAQQRDNDMGRAMAHKQLGVIYLNMKQPDLALEDFRQCIDLLKDNDSETSSLCNIYYRMSKAYEMKHDYVNELKLNDKWLALVEQIAKKSDDRTIYGLFNSCFIARASAYIGLRNFPEAERALHKAERSTRLSNSNLSHQHFYKMMARYCLIMGEPSKAIAYCDSVGSTDEPGEEREGGIDEIRGRALMMLGLGMESAKVFQRLYLQRDSLFGHEARQHLDELNIQEESEETKQTFFLIIVVIIFCALLILGIWGWVFARRLKLTNDKLRIANDQLCVANERASVSSKMKTEFIRNISHEIRTPLNIVSGFAQILTTPGVSIPDRDMTDIHSRMTENTDRITKLVDRMLELSDASSEVVIERNDHSDVLHIVTLAVDNSRIALHTFPGDADSQVTFESLINLSPGEIPLLTHQTYAIRILAQMLENAWKFTKQGKITLSMEHDDNLVRLIVEDTGVGIPPTDVEHIFDEFVQLDPFADGTGIGLTVARSLARRMGGNLWLADTSTTGSRFVFELLRK